MAILEVRDLYQSIMISTMMGKFLKNDFKKSLMKTYLRDYPDILVWAEKYAHMEEVFTENDVLASSVAAGGQNKEHSLRQEERT